MNNIDYILDKIEQKYHVIAAHRFWVFHKSSKVIEIYENDPGYDMIIDKTSMVRFKHIRENHKYINYIRFVEGDRALYYIHRKKCLKCGLDEAINYNKYLGCEEYIMDCALV